MNDFEGHPGPPQADPPQTPQNDFDPSRWIIAAAIFIFTISLIWMILLAMHRPALSS